MRTVVTNKELPHLWAHQTQNRARNGTGSFYSNGDTIYSYGSHFPIASHVTNKRGDKAVLLTTRTASVTTSSHVSRVQRAIPSGTRVFNVALPRCYWNELDKVEAVKSYNERIAQHELRAARARKDYSRNYELSQAAKTHDEAIAFVKFYSLKGKAAKIRPLTTDLAEVKAAAAKDAARKAAETKRLKIELEAKSADAVAAWQRGEPGGYVPYKLDTRLRVIDGMVETSRGARFPIRDARRGLALVDATVASKKPWLPSAREWAKGIRMGHYRIDRIDANGTVHAGCHVVPLKSINAVREDILNAAEPDLGVVEVTA